MTTDQQHDPALVVTGLGFAEGPAPVGDHVLFVEIWNGRVTQWSPTAGIDKVAHLGGGPSSVCVGVDGTLFVAQNGGRERAWRSSRQLPPSIQFIDTSGRAGTAVTEVDGVKLAAPNDLAFSRDGRLFFTDPGPWDDFHEPPSAGRIFALDAGGTGTVVYETGPTFPNGIACTADGAIVWTESCTGAVRRLAPGATEAEEICVLPGHVLDGLAIAENGDLYIAVFSHAGIAVIAADGRSKEWIPVGAAPTNCAFRGSTLWITDGGSGTGENPTQTGALWRLDLNGIRGAETFQGTIA